MRKHLLTTIIVTMSLHSAAWAQDAPQDRLSDTYFTGFYGGLEVGYTGYSFDNVEELNSGGMSYGGLLGYRVPVSPGILLGLESRIGGNGAGKDVGIVELGSGLDWSISGLVGFTAGKNLVFATLGYGETDITASAMGFSVSTGEGGLHAGLGMEFKVGQKTALRLSGQWQDYNQARSLGASLGVIFQF